MIKLKIICIFYNIWVVKILYIFFGIIEGYLMYIYKK